MWKRGLITSQAAQTTTYVTQNHALKWATHTTIAGIAQKKYTMKKEEAPILNAFTNA